MNSVLPENNEWVTEEDSSDWLVQAVQEEIPSEKREIITGAKGMMKMDKGDHAATNMGNGEDKAMDAMAGGPPPPGIDATKWMIVNHHYIQDGADCTQQDADRKQQCWCTFLDAPDKGNTFKSWATVGTKTC